MPRKENIMRPTQHEWYIPRGGRFYGSLEQPEEITVYCTCGEWEFFSQAGAGGGCDTGFLPDFEAHVSEEAFD